MVFVCERNKVSLVRAVVIVVFVGLVDVLMWSSFQEMVSLQSVESEREREREIRDMDTGEVQYSVDWNRKYIKQKSYQNFKRDYGVQSSISYETV